MIKLFKVLTFQKLWLPHSLIYWKISNIYRIEQSKDLSKRVKK